MWKMKWLPETETVHLWLKKKNRLPLKKTLIAYSFDCQQKKNPELPQNNISLNEPITNGHK